MALMSLIDRIRDEYCELPGLNLTMWQLLRLFGADEESLRGALDALVAEGFLKRTPSRTFVVAPWHVRPSSARRNGVSASAL